MQLMHVWFKMPPLTLVSISQFHRSLKEFNKKLIAVTSCLDAVVASINALCAMVNQCYAAFKLMPWIKYTGYANFANDIGKAIIFLVSWHLSKANRTY